VTGLPSLSVAPVSYRRDIDGLRALAIVLVVVFHALPTTLPGGFVGVDVFFVISGFLISGHIVAELDAGAFNVLNFYGRRIRRIFPALCLVLAVTLSYGFVVLLPAELAALGLDVAAGAGFVANILLWNEAGYFDRLTIYKPLLHLWSLGVEEQFYILWPFLLWGVHKITNGWIACFIMITLGSFALNLAASQTYITADFYLPVTRFWELSTGASLAWLVSSPLMSQFTDWRSSRPFFNKFNDVVSIVGLLLIIGAAAVLNQAMNFPGWLAVFPVLGAGLIIAASPSGFINRRFLSHRFVVFIGLISYPLYLWHWPLISYAYIIDHGHALKTLPALLIVMISVLLAWLTYRFVERPLRFGGHRRAKTFFLLGAMVVVGGIGGVTFCAHGFASRYRNLPQIDLSHINAAVRDGIFQPTRSMQVEKIKGVTIAKIGDGPSTVLFVGDSVLFQYGPRVQALLDAGRLRKTVYFIVGPSCAPIPGIIKTGLFAYCNHMPQIAASFVASHAVEAIVLGAAWQGYRGKDVAVERNGAPEMPITDQAAIDALYANLDDEVRQWERDGHQVYLVLASPSETGFDPSLMVRRSLTGFTVSPGVMTPLATSNVKASLDATNTELTRIASATGARTFDPLPDICGTGPDCSAFYDDGRPKFADEMHLRPGFVEDHISIFDGLLTQAR
jgi:peptidoglycan/LPS O-acetylase OafA/YrhL